MRFEVLAGALFLAELLAASLVYKLVRWREFSDALADFTILASFPAFMQPVLRLGVPLLEFATAVLLIVPGTTRIGLMLGFGALIMFTVAVGADRREAVASCGCWGTVSLDVPRRLLAARNGVMLAVASVSLAIALTHSVPDPASRRGIVAACLILPFVLLTFELPTLVRVASFSVASQEARSS